MNLIFFNSCRYGNGYYLTLVMDDGSTDKPNSIEDIQEETKEDILEESNGLLKQKSTSNASLSASDEIDAFLQNSTTCTSVADNIENIETEANTKESVSVLDMAIGNH